MAQDFYDILQVLDYLHDRIDNNKVELGLKYITYGDELLFPEYPVCVITAERPISTRHHATRQYARTFTCDIWVFHAKLSERRRIRNREDMKLARRLELFLNKDRTLDGHIIFGHVTDMQPITIGRTNGNRADGVIGTRLVWQGDNRVMWSIEDELTV